MLPDYTLPVNCNVNSNTRAWAVMMLEYNIFVGWGCLAVYRTYRKQILKIFPAILATCGLTVWKFNGIRFRIGSLRFEKRSGRFGHTLADANRG